MGIWVKRAMKQDDSAQHDDTVASFDKRLETARLKAGLVAKPKSDRDRSPDDNPLTMAMRLGSEMVGALAIAVVIGYGLDRLLDTAPWFMIGLVPIGAAAGILNVFRAAGSSRPNTKPKD